MAAPLPRLRADLDIMPSPLPGRPGLLIRDPFRFSEVTLVVPPLLARCLGCFDGAHDEDDLRAGLAALAERDDLAEATRQLVTALHEAGFLDDQRFGELRATKLAEFAAMPERPAAHAGSAYPESATALRSTLAGYRGANGGTPAATEPCRDIAAPHVSPQGGGASFAHAFSALPADRGDRVFIVLGTSHYGEPDRFGLTRKPFATPFGIARNETTLVDELARAAPSAVVMEDYCHAAEHSIELQIVFLQHRFGPGVRVVPILCGAFIAGPAASRLPEASVPVARFIGALGEVAARDRDRLAFVLGVDFAHVGRRYGDRHAARAHEGAMTTVASRDRDRLARITAGDARGFADLVWEHGEDDLKWCGTSPLYTYLRALPETRGRVLCYEQWNIDDRSVVSFGALAFAGDSESKTP
jgi:MEMO1 family protein